MYPKFIPFIAKCTNYTNYANKKVLYEKEILFVSIATRAARIRVIRDEKPGLYEKLFFLNGFE